METKTKERGRGIVVHTYLELNSSRGWNPLYIYTSQKKAIEQLSRLNPLKMFTSAVSNPI